MFRVIVAGRVFGRRGVTVRVLVVVWFCVLA